MADRELHRVSKPPWVLNTYNERIVSDGEHVWVGEIKDPELPATAKVPFETFGRLLEDVSHSALCSQTVLDDGDETQVRIERDDDGLDGDVTVCIGDRERCTNTGELHALLDASSDN